VEFVDGQVRSGGRAMPLADAAKYGELVAEDFMEYGDLAERYDRQTFGAHFVEVAVDRYTGVIRIRRMLAVCAAGRILNPLTARSQVIGGMTMGIGAALMEELAVDTRLGFFVNHDLAGYEVPVHADVPHLDVVFIDEVDPTMSPLKAKGVGELGLTGVAAAIANAVYNATGVRVRDYPLTLEKHLSTDSREELEELSQRSGVAVIADTLRTRPDGSTRVFERVPASGACWKRGVPNLFLYSKENIAHHPARVPSEFGTKTPLGISWMEVGGTRGDMAAWIGESAASSMPLDYNGRMPGLYAVAVRTDQGEVVIRRRNHLEAHSVDKRDLAGVAGKSK
jgi:hypothetical protein